MTLINSLDSLRLSKDTRRTTTIRVKVTPFGDGYEQVETEALNAAYDGLNVVTDLLTRKEVDGLRAFQKRNQARSFRLATHYDKVQLEGEFTDGSLDLGYRGIQDHKVYIDVSKVSDYIEVFSTPRAFLARRLGGGVEAWGNAATGGQIPSATHSLLTSVTTAASTQGAFAVLQNSSTVYAWGNQSQGGNAPAGLTGVSRLFSNDASFAALKNDKTVVAWGSSSTGGAIPASVQASLVNIDHVVAAPNAFYAMKETSTPGLFDAIGWGQTRLGQTDLTGIKALAVHAFGGIALKADGTVVNWGLANYRLNATQLAAFTGVESIYACDSAFAGLKPDGSVVSGGDDYAEITPEQAPHLTGVRLVVPGRFSFAVLKSDSSVAGWGLWADYVNPGGQHAPASNSGFVSITPSGNGSAFAALRSDGTVHTWGDNLSGAFSAPAQPALVNVRSITATDRAFAAIRTDGSVVTWGNQEEGGNSSEVQNLLKGVASIVSNQKAFTALLNTGALVSWGASGYGTELLVEQSVDVDRTNGILTTTSVEDGRVVDIRLTLTPKLWRFEGQIDFQFEGGSIYQRARFKLKQVFL